RGRRNGASGAHGAAHGGASGAHGAASDASAAGGERRRLRDADTNPNPTTNTPANPAASVGQRPQQ
ncbi:hypothetical protein, partial [Cupriavidus pauculus]